MEGPWVMVRGRSAWRSSEVLARSLLEDMGYRILEVHKRIIVNGVEVGEVDFLAERDGIRYAVEVKAGLVDVSGVRQAYVNAELLGARALVVARGSDDKARELAGRLGVELVLLPDIVYASTDDLYMAVREAVYDAVGELLSVAEHCGALGEEELETLKALSGSDTVKEAAERLGVGVDDLAKRLAGLRRKGVLPRGNYRVLRLAAKLLVLCTSHGRSE